MKLSFHSDHASFHLFLVQLVVYVILNSEFDRDAVDKGDLKTAMKHSVKIHLNPLFGISDIVIAESLPRTASNKVMRRLLRDEYMKVSSP